MNKRSTIFVLTITSLLLTFCSSPSSNTQAVTAPSMISNTSTLALSTTVLLIATGTPLPFATPRPPEPTFPSIPTLTIEESQDTISKLMQGNSECLFPCWWGVVPRRSSWSYARSMLAYLNLKWSSVELPEGVGHSSEFGGDGSYTFGTVGFTTDNTIVEDIHIHGDGIYDSAFANRWKRYSLTEILNTYGYPSRIWVIVADDGPRKSYHIWLFYDETKSLIMYSGSSDSNDLCPDFSRQQVNWLDIYLQSPDKTRKLIDITDVSKKIELLDQPDYYEVEKMTDVRINELYDLFTQSKESACFQISAN